ncbi:MAG: cache domain-containing protein, partial [Eubacteriales bacterium]|nr:cache domain-containing protein [Eubacteriales bacterium]
MKRKKSLGIFMQLILLVSSIILIPLTLLSLYFHQAMRNYTVEQLVHSQLKSLNQLDQNLARITNELNAIIKSYDDSPAIEERLNQFYDSEEERSEAKAELEADLIRKVKDYSWVDCNLILIGKNQTIYSSSEHTPRLSTEVIYNSYWYQKNKADTENINYEIFNRSYFNPKDSSPNIVGIKTLVNKKTGQAYGIAVLEIKESYFYDIYKDILEEGETLYLQTESGKVLSTSDRKVSLTLDPKDILLPPGEKDVQNPYLYNGKEYVYILKKAEVGIWNIVNLIPLENVNLQFEKYFNVFFTVEIFVFAFAIIGILFIGNR